MENVIIIGILVVIIGLAAFYVYKEKKNGKKCIGCPGGGCCSAQHGKAGCSGCSGSCHK